MPKESGIIESRDVKDVQNRDGGTSQKISLKINGKSFSQFSNSRDLSPEAAERLEAYRTGDSVDLTYIEKQSEWNGKPVTYRNITDIMKTIQVGQSAFEDGRPPLAIVIPADRPEKPKPAGDSRSQDGSRDDMMRLSYSKDTIVAILTRGYLAMADGETEELFIARVFSLIKAGAKTLGE